MRTCDVRAGDDPRSGFLRPLIGDGRPLLLAVAGSLVFAGGFMLFLAATGDFLPHDVHYLGMTADDLCAVQSCRIVDFMVHDRAAFGGTLVGLGVLYTWLTVFPLGSGEQWAWWAWVLSGAIGFLTFFAYLGYGYLDTWHGIGTTLLAPVYVFGIVRTRRLLIGPVSVKSLLQNGGWIGGRGRYMLGRSLLLIGAAATAFGGLAILRVGVGDTFVPEDLEFIGISASELEEINPRLTSLLAHDRAGFGGGVLTMGLTTMLCLWCGRPSRHLHQAIALAGTVSLGAAIGVHFAVGYTDVWHLLPAVAAAASLLAGLALEHPGLSDDSNPDSED
jgi:hypothetical protein